MKNEDRKEVKKKKLFKTKRLKKRKPDDLNDLEEEEWPCLICLGRYKKSRPCE